MMIICVPLITYCAQGADRISNIEISYNVIFITLKLQTGWKEATK